MTNKARHRKVSRPHVRRTRRVGGRGEIELDARVERDSRARIARLSSLNHLRLRLKFALPIEPARLSCGHSRKCPSRSPWHGGVPSARSAD